MSNSNPIDGSINTNLAFERGGKPCETILSPYVQIGGPDMYGLIRPDWADAAYDRSFAFPPIQRFTLSTAVAPMDGEGPAYPGNSTWVLNLDLTLLPLILQHPLLVWNVMNKARVLVMTELTRPPYQ